jgi:hypothetical protein
MLQAKWSQILKSGSLRNMMEILGMTCLTKKIKVSPCISDAGNHSALRAVSITKQGHKPRIQENGYHNRKRTTGATSTKICLLTPFPLQNLFSSFYLKVYA